MERKRMQPKRTPNTPGRGEKEHQNPTADKIESWLLKLPPSLLEEEGQRTVPEKTSTTGTTTSKTAKQKKKRKIAKERRRKMKERNEENKEDKTGENRRESENPKEKRGKRKGENEEENEVKTEEKILRPAVDISIEIEEFEGKRGQTPLHNKVDKVTLHRKLKEFKKSQSTLFSASRGSRMPQNKWEHGNQKPKETVMSDSNALGWRESWDIFIPDYHAEKGRKKHEIIRKEEQNKLAEVEPVDLDVITERTIKTHKDHWKDDIFGYRSLLNEQTRIIYQAYSTSATKESETENRESSSGPDMSWVRRLSPSDKQSKRKSTLRHRVGPKGERENPLYIIWIYLILGARMPFVFVRNPDPSIGFVSCKFDRHRRYYYAFLVTSVLLLLLTVISLFSFFAIFFEAEREKDPHIQIAKLLLDKNWVAGIVFVTTLIMATISSFHVLKNGEEMAEYITQWEESLDGLNFNATTGIRLLTTIFIVWTTGQAAGEAILFYNKRLELNPYIEGVHLMILLVFRYWDKEILISANRDYYGALVIGLNNYALYCSRSFIVLVMVFSVGMTNIANEWNFRLRLILNYVLTREHEASIRDLLQNLNYRKVFDEHQRIAKLVKDTSKVFGTLLLSFYLTQGIDLAGQLVEIAVYTVGLKSTEKSEFANLTAEMVNYKYEKDGYNRLDVAIRLSQTVTVVVIVSVYLAATGEAMMDALYLITRHSHLKTESTHQRNFMMSLVMSFNPKQPYLLGSGGILHVDKSFMYSYFAVAVYFLSVMMQTRIPRLLSFPSGTLCSGVQQVRLSGNESIYSMNPELPPKFTTTNDSSTTGFPTSTTTTALAITTTLMATTTTTTTPTPTRPLSRSRCTGASMPGSQLFKCKGAEVDRARVYDQDGFERTDRLKNSFNCIYDPYPPLSSSGDDYFDCFGNPLKERDSCGMLNFGVGTTLPTLVDRTLRFPNRIRPIPITCHNLDKTYYLPSNASTIRDEPFYVCGYPHWLARVICLDSSITPEPPRNLTLLDFQKAIYAEMRRDLVLPANVTRCTTLPVYSDMTEAVLAYSRSAGKVVNLPEVFPRARRYFPFFHPDLLGPSYLGNLSVYACRRFFDQIPLTHDDCGGLDLRGTNVKKFNVTTPGTTFHCFISPIRAKICNPTNCQEWTEWFNADKPVF